MTKQQQPRTVYIVCYKKKEGMEEWCVCVYGGGGDETQAMHVCARHGFIQRLLGRNTTAPVLCMGGYPGSAAASPADPASDLGSRLRHTAQPGCQRDPVVRPRRGAADAARRHLLVPNN